jgi:hypothetical protein
MRNSRAPAFRPPSCKASSSRSGSPLHISLRGSCGGAWKWRCLSRTSPPSPPSISATRARNLGYAKTDPSFRQRETHSPETSKTSRGPHRPLLRQARARAPPRLGPTATGGCLLARPRRRRCCGCWSPRGIASAGARRAWRPVSRPTRSGGCCRGRSCWAPPRAR